MGLGGNTRRRQLAEITAAQLRDSTGNNVVVITNLTKEQVGLLRNVLYQSIASQCSIHVNVDLIPENRKGD
jgi:hypothetical protein